MRSADDKAREAHAREDETVGPSLGEAARALIARSTISRRRALRWIGGAVASALLARFPGAASAAPATGPTELGAPAQHGARLRGLLLPAKRRSLEGRFGLMFKSLPAFEPPDDLLVELAASMEEPRDAPPSATDNPRVPSGFVLLGQFIDHDLTFDDTPIPEQREDPLARKNFRTARLDLDSLYGAGPEKSPELYDPSDPAKLRIVGLGDPDAPDDLPRQSDGKAIIGDPRNDENLVICQLHLAFMKFHNALVDHAREQGVRGTDELFAEARRLCRWHYQWVVVHDFLPRMVGRDTLDAILRERADGSVGVKLDFYKPKNPEKPMMPVEFSAAAFRFGHSMLRPGYVINEEGGGAALFGEQPTDFNLNGSRPCPKRLVIAWRHFFDVPGAPGTPVNGARRLDSDLSLPLFSLPASVVPPPDTRVSLAERNLLRGKRLGLPSGQRVARQMGAVPLSNRELGLGEGPGWEGQAPLWFYVLKEAELRHDGERLGAVGGRIVAETILGLLELDRSSYLRAASAWRPEPPIARASGLLEVGDLLRFAGAV